MSDEIKTEQSEMFEDAFLRNLKSLQGKIIKQQHVNTTGNSTDMQYIGDSTRKLVELKLLELETIISARKKEEEWIRRREIRAAQSDRIEQARQNLATLVMLNEKGKVGLEDDIESNLAVLREVSNIGGEEVYPKEIEVNSDKILDSFHMTEKDLKKAFNTTNVMDIVRQAKKNGWSMKISEDEVSLYKNGKRINGNENMLIASPSKNRSTKNKVSKTIKRK